MMPRHERASRKPHRCSRRRTRRFRPRERTPARHAAVGDAMRSSHCSSLHVRANTPGDAGDRVTELSSSIASGRNRMAADFVCPLMASARGPRRLPIERRHRPFRCRAARPGDRAAAIIGVAGTLCACAFSGRRMPQGPRGGLWDRLHPPAKRRRSCGSPTGSATTVHGLASESSSASSRSSSLPTTAAAGRCARSASADAIASAALQPAQAPARSRSAPRGQERGSGVPRQGRGPG